MELSQIETQSDFVTNQARDKAASLSSDDVQREILAQLYIQNQNTLVQTKEIGKIKGHLVFYTIMYLIALFSAIAIFGK